MSRYDGVGFPGGIGHPLGGLPEAILECMRNAVHQMSDVDMSDPDDREAMADAMLIHLRAHGYLSRAARFVAVADEHEVDKGPMWAKVFDLNGWPHAPDITALVFGENVPITVVMANWAAERLNLGMRADFKLWTEHVNTKENAT